MGWQNTSRQRKVRGMTKNFRSKVIEVTLSRFRLSLVGSILYCIDSFCRENTKSSGSQNKMFSLDFKTESREGPVDRSIGVCVANAKNRKMSPITHVNFKPIAIQFLQIKTQYQLFWLEDERKSFFHQSTEVISETKEKSSSNLSPQICYRPPSGQS